MSWQVIDGKVGNLTGFEAVLPLGAYAESYFPENETDIMLDVIDQMAALNMNMIYLRISASFSCQELISRAVSHKMKIVIEPNGLSDEECITSVGIENVAAILNQDDQENIDEIYCQQRYEEISAEFPTIPIYSTGYKTTASAKKSRKWADVSSQQNYPTGQQADILEHSVNVYEAAKDITTVNWSNPQCYFGYTSTHPTKEEIIQMGFAALAKTKGLLWYTFFNWDHKNNKIWFNILDHPEWLEGVKLVCDTARQHEALILSTECQVVKLQDGYNFLWTDGNTSLEVYTGKREVTKTEVFNTVIEA